MIITNLNTLFDEMEKQVESLSPNISPIVVMQEMKARLGDKFIVVSKQDMDRVQKLITAVNAVNEFCASGR